MFLVVGANGFLGSYIVKTLLETTAEPITSTCRDTARVFVTDPRLRWIACDIERAEEVDALADLVNREPEPVRCAFLAAMHHPDAVEQDPTRAWHINIEMLGRFLDRAENLACLYYPSTDSVYGDSVDGYHFRESDALTPVNTYGRQKAAAEQVVVGAGCNVVRFPFLAGKSLLPHKKHFCDVIEETILSGQPMELFSDSLRSSIDFGTAAALLVRLMTAHSPDYPHILNLSGDEDLSKYDVGLRIAQRCGADARFVVPVSVEENNGIFVTRRAKSTLLDNTLVKKTLGIDEIQINV